ncbi:MAG: hypothetical protein ACP5Q5_05490 [Brevinematia bacterium]
MKCSICSTEVEELALGNSNLLYRCPKCYHIFRDLKKCFAFAREHP